jgi:hypothetical protein
VVVNGSAVNVKFIAPFTGVPWNAFEVGEEEEPFDPLPLSLEDEPGLVELAVPEYDERLPLSVMNETWVSSVTIWLFLSRTITPTKMDLPQLTDGEESVN